MKLRLGFLTIAAIFALPVSANASWVAMRSQYPHNVEVLYYAEKDESPNNVTVSSSDDGSVVYITDAAATVSYTHLTLPTICSV